MLALLAVGLALVWWLRAIFQPLLLGLLFAYLLNPIVVWCQHTWQWRRLSVIVTLTSVALFGIVAVMFTVVPLVVSQTVELARNLPDYADAVAQKFGISDEEVLQQVREKASVLMQDPVTNLSRVWDGFVTSFGVVTGVVGTITSLAVGIALFPIYVFFFSWKLPAILESMEELVPKHRRPRVHGVLSKMDAAVGGYFRTRLIIAFVMGVLYAGGWGLAGVPYWLLLGILGGLLGIIPYAATLAWLAAMLLQFLDLENGITGAGDMQTVFLWPTLVYGLVQASDDWFLTPWLQGQELNMSFVTIILAVLIGGAVAGLLGMLLAVPVAACISIFWTDVVRPQIVNYAQSH